MLIRKRKDINRLILDFKHIDINISNSTNLKHMT